MPAANTSLSYSHAVVDCGVPERGNNTNVSMTATTFDSIVLYSCAVGYEAHGYTLPLIRQCQANGTWNSTALLCTRKIPFMNISIL